MKQKDQNKLNEMAAQYAAAAAAKKAAEETRKELEGEIRLFVEANMDEMYPTGKGTYTCSNGVKIVIGTTSEVSLPKSEQDKNFAYNRLSQECPETLNITIATGKVKALADNQHFQLLFDKLGIKIDESETFKILV